MDGIIVSIDNDSLIVKLNKKKYEMCATIMEHLGKYKETEDDEYARLLKNITLKMGHLKLGSQLVSTFSAENETDVH